MDGAVDYEALGYFDNTRVSYYNKHFLKLFYIKKVFG